MARPSTEDATLIQELADVIRKHVNHADGNDPVTENAVAPENVEEAPVTDGDNTMLEEPVAPVEESRTDNDLILGLLEKLREALTAGKVDCGNNDSEEEEENTDSDDGTKEEAKADGETEEDLEDDSEEAENADASDLSQSKAHADSADEIVRTRLSICRVGDKLNMDGLEDMSIMDAKKAIVKKVLPEMRLDGKGSAYIDAAYDIAVAQANKPKDENYQRQQMFNNGQMNLDSNENKGFSAADARRNMINRREGGVQ